MKKKLFFAVYLAVASVCLFAQSTDNDSSKSQRVNISMGSSRHIFGDYILQKKFPVKVMLESGIPYPILDSTFVFTHKDELNISLSESNLTMNFVGKKMKCPYITTDSIFLNNMYYKGQVLIADLGPERQLMYPIHTFKNLDDADSRIIKLNISEKYIEPLTRKELEQEIKGYDKFPMKNGGYGNMYVMDSKFTILANKHYYSMKGEFLLDLGNASFLFLMEQHPSCKTFLENSDIKVQQGRNNKGELIPVKAFWTSECRIASHSFEDVTVAITQSLPKFTSAGVLGLKFFECFSVIFDYDENVVYLRKIKRK